MEKWDILVELTRDDIYRSLKYGDIRRVGTAGRVVETVVLGLLAVWCIVPFFVQGREALSSLLLGILSLFLIASLWIVPEWRARHLSGQETKDRKPTRLRVYEEGLRFGEAEDLHAFGTETVTSLPGLFVLRYGTELVPLPHRELPEDCLAFLKQKWEEEPDPDNGAEL